MDQLEIIRTLDSLLLEGKPEYKEQTAMAPLQGCSLH